MFLQKKIQTNPSQRIKLPLAEGPMTNLVVQDSFEGLNALWIKRLVENSFGKTLVPGYFDLPVTAVVMEPGYKGIAIVKQVFDIPYLDKIAVAPGFQKNGIGKQLWDYLKAICPSLIWRAREDNPATEWYARNSDGSAKDGKWNIFWYNLDPSAEVISMVSGKPETLLSDALPEKHEQNSHGYYPNN